MSEPKDINIFFTGISEKIRNGTVVKPQFDIRHDLLQNSECFYIFDLLAGNIVYQHRLKEVLGLEAPVLQYNQLVAQMHPDDVEPVLRLTRGTVNYCVDNPGKCKNSTLQLTYRFKHGNGSYIRLLSQSSVYKSENGILRLILVKLTDISFLESTEYVNWSFESKDLDQEKFKQSIFSSYRDFFTKRELEIIREIAQKKSTREIAAALNISELTVSTHRKNILKKANRHNTDDLIIFCKRKGII